MLEVRYNKWTAWLQIGVGTGVAGLGGYAAYYYFLQGQLGYSFGNLGIVVIGLLIVRTAHLRLEERGVLVRFTEKEIWTKEFGWQPWDKLIVKLEADRNGQTVEIHKPGNPTPRFYARVGVLTVTAEEIKSWIVRFGRSD